jgi:hypothetical protein
VQKQYAETGAANNGVIVLQFLQTEVLLDMLESGLIYEQTPLKYFYFHQHEETTSHIHYSNFIFLPVPMDLYIFKNHFTVDIRRPAAKKNPQEHLTNQFCS